MALGAPDHALRADADGCAAQADAPAATGRASAATLAEAKLDLAEDPRIDRRVRAVLTYVADAQP